MCHSDCLCQRKGTGFCRRWRQAIKAFRRHVGFLMRDFLRTVERIIRQINYEVEDPMITIYEYGRLIELRSRIRDAADYVTEQWFRNESNMRDPETLMRLYDIMCAERNQLLE